MKNLVLLLIGVFVLTVKVNAQLAEYTLNRKRTSEIVDKYIAGTYQVYRVEKKEVSIPIYDTVNLVTDAYKQEKANFDIFYADSLDAAKEYQVAVTDYNRINKIYENIKRFLELDVKFREKKELLKDAQKIANDFNLSFFIYADKDINKQKRADFFSLRLDEAQLADHLRSIAIQVRNHNQKPFMAPNYNLRRSRDRLNSMEQFKIVYKESGDYKTQNAFVMREKIDDVSALEGNFKIVGKFYHVRQSTFEFVTGQLVEQKVFERITGEKKEWSYHPLIYNKVSNQYYFDAGGLIYACGISNDISEFLAKLNALGYKTSHAGENHIIHTNNGKVTLTADILREVKAGNTAYIEEIAASVRSYNALVNQAKPYTDILANHFSAYQHGTLTMERLNRWKKDLAAALTIHEKVENLRGREDDNIYYFQKHLETESLASYVEFVEVLRGSKRILGIN